MKAEGRRGPALAEAACWTSSHARACFSAVLSLQRGWATCFPLPARTPHGSGVELSVVAFEAAPCSQAQGLVSCLTCLSFLGRQGEEIKASVCQPFFLSHLLSCVWQPDAQLHHGLRATEGYAGASGSPAGASHPRTADCMRCLLAPSLDGFPCWGEEGQDGRASRAQLGSVIGEVSMHRGCHRTGVIC